jgi:predicted Rossmann fold nucleotide-binding protein DprA/Smf involved in DNA uptake
VDVKRGFAAEYEVLPARRKVLDELKDRSGLETPALLARLTDLELRDLVRRLPGPLFVRHH